MTAVVELCVTKRTLVADGVLTLTLRHPDGHRLPDWSPGAHIDLTLPTGVTRQYSLCGDRWDAHTYRVGVLREPDGRGGSAYVHDHLTEGATVTIGGPRNNFPLVPAARYLFVAGGIGITPLLPMLVSAEQLGADWLLLYCGQSRGTMAFLDELAPYGEKVTLAVRDEHGRASLADWLPADAPAGRTVYCCGPAALLDEAHRRCAGWPAGRLRTERFVPKAFTAPQRHTAFEVELRRSNVTVTVTPQRSVLGAITEAGVAVLSSCRQGTCGTCATTVLEGRPEHRDSLLDDEERERGERMFVCVSRSRTDRLVLDL
jgi:ferredoxin-NADP reductase